MCLESKNQIHDQSRYPIVLLFGFEIYIIVRVRTCVLGILAKK